jgi:hypothetical protein
MSNNDPCWVSAILPTGDGPIACIHPSSRGGTGDELTCSSLVVYFEIRVAEEKGEPLHPESVGRLEDQGSTMRFYEALRALKGDEGPEMRDLVQTVERTSVQTTEGVEKQAW